MGTFSAAGQSVDGSSQTHASQWDSTLTGNGSGWRGTELTESTSYGGSSTNTVPNPDPYGYGNAGSTTTGSSWDTGSSPMQLSFAVSEDEIVPLALGPLTGGGVAARTYFYNFESGGGSGISVAPPAGTAVASIHAAEATSRGTQAQHTTAPASEFTPGPTPEATAGHIERNGQTQPTPNPAANANQAAQQMGGGVTPLLGGIGSNVIGPVIGALVRYDGVVQDKVDNNEAPSRAVIGGRGTARRPAHKTQIL